jgi:hypothetical protein
MTFTALEPCYPTAVTHSSRQTSKRFNPVTHTPHVGVRYDRKTMLRLSPYILLFALSCKSSETCTKGESVQDGECVPDADDTGDNSSGADADEDGHATPADCDDSDPSVHPGADEYCDGIDNDCDDQTDESDAVNAQPYFADADGDGFGDPETEIMACALEDGLSEDDSDCDDAESSAYPGAEEIWYDGIDNDCLGGDDADADGDGVPGGEGDPDCDDTDPAVHPDAEEQCGDGIDNNCDGDLGDCGRTGELDAPDAEGRLFGSTHDTWAGASLAMTGDLTGDGSPDLLIGAPRSDLTAANSGTAFVVPGPVAGVGLLGDIAYPITGLSSTDQAGTQVLAPGDLDGDGQEDLLVSAPGALSGAGAVYMVSGPIEGNLSLSEASGWIQGDSAELGIGRAIAALGDQDGDGTPELLIGLPDQGEGGTAWLVSAAPIDGAMLSDGHQLSGLSTGDQLGSSIASLGDLNGDGIEDMGIGAPGTDTSTPTGELFSDAGAVYVFFGPVLRDLDMSEADTTLRGVAEGDHAGQTLAGLGDIDGDGLPDLAVGAPSADGNSGAVFIVSGPASASAPLALAQAQILGHVGNAQAGEALSSGGDADRDGLMDLLIGAPQTSASTGAAFLFYGPLEGTLSTSEAPIQVSGEFPGDRLGAALTGGADIDLDGTQDILIGVPGESSSADGAGAVLLFFGEGS